MLFGKNEEIHNAVLRIKKSISDDNVDFIFIGNGECFDYNLPNKSIFYKKERILIDVGYNIFPWLLYLYQEHNLDLFPDIVLLTHKHVDHVGSLEALCHYYEFVLGRNLIIYPSTFCSSFLLRKLDSCSYSSLIKYNNVKIIDIFDNIYHYKKMNDIILHYYIHRGHLVCEGYSYIVGNKNKGILYTGDSRYLLIHQEKFNEYSKKINNIYFVHDYVFIPNVVHASNDDLKLYDIDNEKIIKFNRRFINVGDGI